MARGYSQSRSEGPGYSEGSDRKSKPRSEYAPGTDDYEYKNKVSAELNSLVRAGDADGKTILAMDDSTRNKLVGAIADGTTDARSGLDDFEYQVERANKAIDAGTVDFDSYSEAGAILPLNLSEVMDGADGFDIINDAVEDERPDDIAEFVEEFVKSRILDADALRKEFNEEISLAKENAMETFLKDFRNKS
jgi:hypothetical protein